MQNKILRIISFKCLKDHNNMSELYKSENILRTNNIFKIEVAKFMHSYFHQNLPENFANYFCFASNHHNYATRSITNKNLLVSSIFILLSRESDQCAIRARLGVASHLSTTPRRGNPAKCLSQRHNK